MSRVKLLWSILMIIGCQTNHYKDSIVLDNGVRVKFFEVSTCDKNQDKRYANFNISAKTKNGKLVFSSKYQSLESVSSFYYDSLLAFGMGELFEELCEGDSVLFSIPSGMFIKGIFHNNSTTKFKSINETDSLDVHLKFISFNNDVEQYNYQKQLINRAKKKEAMMISVKRNEWSTKYLDIFNYDDLFSVKVAQSHYDIPEKSDSVKDFIAINYLITDLNDREIYKTKGNLNEYYDKSLNDQLLEGFKILVDHYNIGDSVVAVMPSKMAFGKRGSLVNMIAPYTPLKVSLKIIQK